MSHELCSSSSTMRRKTLTDSLEQSSTLSFFASREEEVKYTPSSNKRSLMPMENTLPSLLATAIFLKLMSSRAAEASLSLELLRVKWANNQAGKYIGVWWNRARFHGDIWCFNLHIFSYQSVLNRTEMSHQTIFIWWDLEGTSDLWRFLGKENFPRQEWT